MYLSYRLDSISIPLNDISTNRERRSINTVLGKPEVKYFHFLLTITLKEVKAYFDDLGSFGQNIPVNALTKATLFSTFLLSHLTSIMTWHLRR